MSPYDILFKGSRCRPSQRHRNLVPWPILSWVSTFASSCLQAVCKVVDISKNNSCAQLLIWKFYLGKMSLHDAPCHDLAVTREWYGRCSQYIYCIALLTVNTECHRGIFSKTSTILQTPVVSHSNRPTHVRLTTWTHLYAENLHLAIALQDVARPADSLIIRSFKVQGLLVLT